ncbi:MAG TPA: ATP-binding protein [Terriglobia bacterium]|nr:ATP-binding protein [Terriglobia bacterium]
MKVSLKSKLTALISILVLLVVVAISGIYIGSLTRQALEEVRSRGKFVADEIYHMARTVLAETHIPPGVDPNSPAQIQALVQQTLANDSKLNSLIAATVGYSPTIYYVAITDASGKIIVHSDPSEIGQVLAPAQDFDKLRGAGMARQLRVIYGQPEIYEIVLPLDLGGYPLTVHVALYTLFVRNEVTPELRTAGILSGLAILLATFSAGVLSFRVLRPLETISRGVDSLTRGEFPISLHLSRNDEWGVLSSKLNLLGEQIRGEKAAYVALKENMDQLLSNLTDGMLLFDQQDRLVMTTPSAARFLGRSPDTLLHHPVPDVFLDGRPLEKFLRRAFEEGRSFPWQVVETGGEIPRVSVSVQFVEEEGARVATLVTLRDASTRAQLEDQIDVAAKLAALGKLTSGVAHEVKNPLNAMVLQLELLKSKLDNEGERVKPQIDTLSEEIRRLDRVVKTFLDFTRPVELRPSQADLEKIVREVFTLAEPLARQSNVNLVLQSNGALPSLTLDRDLIKQALLNLVLNGCQAMSSGGELRVTPRLLARHVELDIADQGSGIPPEVRPRLFSLFFTTKPNGTGIGLAMAYRIIQLHNGTIDYVSEVNRGTTFRIMLPR